MTPYEIGRKAKREYVGNDWPRPENYGFTGKEAEEFEAGTCSDLSGPTMDEMLYHPSYWPEI